MITIHAGHAPGGCQGCGAIGYLDESVENRKVLRHLKTYLDSAGIEYEDITYKEGAPANDILNALVKRANAIEAKLHVSIHLDSFDSPTAHGTGSWYYPMSAGGANAGKLIADEVSAALGTKNRGITAKKNLAFLNRTAAPAVIVECCFVSSQTDVGLWDPEACAVGIARGIAKYLGVHTDFRPDPGSDAPAPEGKFYRVQVGAFSNRSNAENLRKQLISQGYDAVVKEV